MATWVFGSNVAMVPLGKRTLMRAHVDEDDNQEESQTAKRKRGKGAWRERKNKVEGQARTMTNFKKDHHELYQKHFFGWMNVSSALTRRPPSGVMRSRMNPSPRTRWSFFGM